MYAPQMRWVAAGEREEGNCRRLQRTRAVQADHMLGKCLLQPEVGLEVTALKSVLESWTAVF